MVSRYDVAPDTLPAERREDAEYDYIKSPGRGKTVPRFTRIWVQGDHDRQATSET